MKILFDTNVLIAAFVHNGKCYEIVQSATERHKVFYSSFIIDELKRILNEKFHLNHTTIKDIVSFIEKYFIRGLSGHCINGLCRDPKDDQILADALANDIDIIVTGDKDLLHLKKYHNIKILPPNAF